MKISQSKFKVLKQEKNLLGGKNKKGGTGFEKKCGTFEVGISFLFLFWKKSSVFFHMVLYGMSNSKDVGKTQTDPSI